MRDQFLSELKNWLRDQMSKASSIDLNHRAQSLSMEERSLLWKFSVLDKNKDGVLKKKELRVLKGELRQMAGLKGCGKLINKHCDTNSDSIVTSDEWRACFIQGHESRGR